jgi:hypothetical protein
MSRVLQSAEALYADVILAIKNSRKEIDID